MSEKIVQLNEEVIKGQIKELVRGSVEETLNELLEKEAESLTQAARYERSEARQGYRSGHYDRNLTTTSGDVTLHMPRLSFVEEVHIFEEPQADGKFLKSIKFRFPIPYEGDSIRELSWDKSSTVEAVVLLSRETDPRTVEVGMEAETGEGKRVNYTGKA